MKNKNIIIIIIVVIVIGLISFGLIKFYKQKEYSNPLNGYYMLEKIISYYKTEDDERTNEMIKNNGLNKIYINNNIVETKIIDIDNYYCMTNNNRLYYGKNKLKEKTLETEKYFEYELNDDYLVLIQRSEVTDTYYYKKITKEEY